jgi:hypothetical protein
MRLAVACHKKRPRPDVAGWTAQFSLINFQIALLHRDHVIVEEVGYNAGRRRRRPSFPPETYCWEHESVIMSINCTLSVRPDIFGDRAICVPTMTASPTAARTSRQAELLVAESTEPGGALAYARDTPSFGYYGKIC